MVRVEMINGMYRVVDENTGIVARGASGASMDNGGHRLEKDALAHAIHVNVNIRKMNMAMGYESMSDSMSDDLEAVCLSISADERNSMPDSSFAIVMPGGTKDDNGRTVPRSSRKLPYRDAKGAVIKDLANAAIAALNGARGGVDAPTPIKVLAWNKIISSLRASDPHYKPPARTF